MNDINQPNPKHIVLIDEINQWIDSCDGNTDLFTLARYKNEAEKLSKSDLAWSLLINGILAGVERNEVDMRKFYENVINRFPGFSIALENYAISLRSFAHIEEACEKLLLAYQYDEANPTIIDNLIRYHIEACDFTEAKVWLAEWVKVKPNESHELVNFVYEVDEFLCRKNTSTEITKNIISLVYDIIRENKIFESSLHFTIKEDEDSEWFSLTAKTNESIATVTKLNIALVDKLAEQDFLSDFSTLFTARFQSA